LPRKASQLSGGLFFFCGEYRSPIMSIKCTERSMRICEKTEIFVCIHVILMALCINAVILHALLHVVGCPALMWKILHAIVVR